MFATRDRGKRTWPTILGGGAVVIEPAATDKTSRAAYSEGWELRGLGERVCDLK